MDKYLAEILLKTGEYIYYIFTLEEKNEEIAYKKIYDWLQVEYFEYDENEKNHTSFYCFEIFNFNDIKKVQLKGATRKSMVLIVCEDEINCIIEPGINIRNILNDEEKEYKIITDWIYKTYEDIDDYSIHFIDTISEIQL